MPCFDSRKTVLYTIIVIIIITFSPHLAIQGKRSSCIYTGQQNNAIVCWCKRLFQIQFDVICHFKNSLTVKYYCVVNAVFSPQVCLLYSVFRIFQSTWRKNTGCHFGVFILFRPSLGAVDLQFAQLNFRCFGDPAFRQGLKVQARPSP